MRVDRLSKTDEARFHHIDRSSKQKQKNRRYWSESKPMVIKEKPLHSSKVTGMWIGVSTRVLVRLYFSDGSINPDHYYVRTLQTYIISELKGTDGNAKDYLVPTKDGAKSCCVWCVHGRLVVLPILRSSDIFLQVRLKSKVLVDKMRTLKALIANI